MSIKFHLSRQVSAPPERVYAVMTDIDGYGAWMPGLVRIERVTEGPMRVGSEFRETRKLLGSESTEQFEVTAMEVPWRLGLRCDGTKGTSRRGEYVFNYRLSPEGDRTRVDVDAEIRGMGPIMSLFGKLMGGMFRKLVARDLEALHDHLEKEKTTPQPAGAA